MKVDQPRLFLGTALLCVFHAQAQLEQSVFSSTGRASATTFVTDYQCIGINPSNLGWKPKYEGKNIALGLAEAGFSIWSQALTKDEVRNEFLRTDHTFTEQERRDAAIKMSEAPLTINGDVTVLGVAFGNDKLGGFGLSIHDRAQWNSTMNGVFTDILFRGYEAGYFDQWILSNGDTIPNPGSLPAGLIEQVVGGIASDPQHAGRLFDGTSIKFNWYREYNLSYGRQLLHNDQFSLYGGVGMKYLSGMGFLDFQAKEGSVFGFSAMSPYFNVDYGAAAASNPSTNNDKSFPPKEVGHGFGLDFGVSAIIKDHIKLGVAFNNIGSITWSGNTYAATDLEIATYAFTGIDNYNLFSNIDNIIGVHSPLGWSGHGERTVPLPSVMRLGAGIKLNEKIEAGADAVFPVNEEPGSYHHPVLGLGGDVKPLPWLQISAGVVAGGDYDTKVPLGITAIVANGTYEAGIASRDAVTFFAQHRPTLSLCAGFLRFRF